MAYEGATVPANVPWEGSAAQVYAASATALAGTCTVTRTRAWPAGCAPMRPMWTLWRSG